jgi:Kef-type K+ transport system membrane component KefB
LSNFELSILFFLQLAIIQAVIRIVGYAGRWIGQPQVVSEMIAGVLLGPSLFGLFWPEIQSALFPKNSVTVIYAVSQVGLVLYMFLVGAEFRVDLVQKRIKSAASISLAGILAPFALGSVLAAFIYHDNQFFSGEIARWEAMLFIGSAMSITAFPMLARIIYERGLTGTTMGTLAMAAGSLDDAAAWCLLAVVVASFSGQPMVAVLAIGGGLLYGIVTIAFGRPLLKRWAKPVEAAGGLTHGRLGFILLLVMLAAFYTDKVGIYAVFGAFILGIAMPRGKVTEDLQKKIEPLVTTLLLPLFFVYSGLNTRLDLVVGPSLIGITLLVLVLSIAGKAIACYLAARFHGESHRSAMGIGTLMNARGLMELILLNIGLERGIITPTLFTIMVIMAIVTTLMATPVFNRIYPDGEIPEERSEDPPPQPARP